MDRIWIIEDDSSIGQGLTRTLQSEGYSVEWAATGAQARALDGSPDLVLLDLGLPDEEGLDLCQYLVERYPSTRVMMLTARSGELDVVSGLDAGAIDYLAKPFRLSELLARVRAQLRSGEVAVGREDTPFCLGDLTIDRGARRVWVGGREAQLRLKEFDLLMRLAETPGCVVRREELMSDVWDSHWFGSTKTLDVHMAALRRHLGEEVGETSRISTVRGVGYRLDR